MTGVLKGNYTATRNVEPEGKQDDLESRFEKEAMKRLGGSIAFVSKKKVKWQLDDNKD